MFSGFKAILKHFFPILSSNKYCYLEMFNNTFIKIKNKNKNILIKLYNYTKP